MRALTAGVPGLESVGSFGADPRRFPSGLEQVTTIEVLQSACRGAHAVAWTAAYHVECQSHPSHVVRFRFQGVDHLPPRLTLLPSRQGPAG